MSEQSASQPKCEILAAAVGLGAAAALSLFLLWIVRPLMSGFFFAVGSLVVVAGVVLVLE